MATITLAVASLALVARSIRELGRQWSVAARLVEGHRLVQTAPYGRIRHPVYAGLLGLGLANGLALSQAWIIPIALVIAFARTFLRMPSEERLLREAFGGRFEEYSRRVARLIPGAW